MRLYAIAAVILAHSWYATTCCSDKDCDPLGPGQIKVVKAGYIVPSGELLSWGDDRIKPSEDAGYHWCRRPWQPTMIDKRHANGIQTICLYVGGAA